MTTALALGFVGLGLMAVALSIGSFVARSVVLAIIAAGIWIVFGVYNFAVLSAAAWDIFYGLGFISIFVGLATALGENYMERRANATSHNVNADVDIDLEDVDEETVKGYRQYHARKRLSDNRRRIMDGHDILLERNLERREEEREYQRMAKDYPNRN